jgi:hypothetical protein
LCGVHSRRGTKGYLAVQLEVVTGMVFFARRAQRKKLRDAEEAEAKLIRQERNAIRAISKNIATFIALRRIMFVCADLL